MRNDKKEKKVATIILSLLLLIAISFGSYIYFFKDLEDNDGEITTLEEKVTAIIPGITLDWPAEKIAFTLPEGWSYEIVEGTTASEKVKIYGPEIRLNLVYLDAADDFAETWNKRDEILFQNNSAIVYKTNTNNVKIALNRTVTISNTNVVDGTTTAVEYGLFINIFKNDELVQEISDLELHYIKYILDNYTSSTISE